MISAATALRLAPDHWLDWLRHRTLAGDLRRLLVRLRLATPATLDDDHKIQCLLRMIASAETDEQASLRALATIENQYRRDKKSKRLRQTTLPNSPKPQRHHLAWLLTFVLLLPSPQRPSRGLQQVNHS